MWWFELKPAYSTRVDHPRCNHGTAEHGNSIVFVWALLATGLVTTRGEVILQGVRDDVADKVGDVCVDIGNRPAVIPVPGDRAKDDLISGIGAWLPSSTSLSGSRRDLALCTGRGTSSLSRKGACGLRRRGMSELGRRETERCRSQRRWCLVHSRSVLSRGNRSRQRGCGIDEGIEGMGDGGGVHPNVLSSGVDIFLTRTLAGRGEVVIHDGFELLRVGYNGVQRVRDRHSVVGAGAVAEGGRAIAASTRVSTAELFAAVEDGRQKAVGNVVYPDPVLPKIFAVLAVRTPEVINELAVVMRIGDLSYLALDGCIREYELCTRLEQAIQVFAADFVVLHGVGLFFGPYFIGEEARLVVEPVQFWTTKVLTDPQIMTAPSIGDGIEIFGDGNVAAGFPAFFCEWFKLPYAGATCEL
ncbi:hypothetical protein C8R45DRAFT_946488 [Mycena sanguinolenta]|nr:hypothetical protein C8R45DRAFT_946488 [Mycena sanguinolenta]